MKKVGALELTRVKVRDLRQHPNNPNQGDIGIIVESLESHGYMKPVLVQKSTMRIIAGNHTVQATEIEGFEEIDVILRDCTDEEALRMILDPIYQRDYETLDDLGDTKSKGPGPARNFISEHSIAEGHDWHWVMIQELSEETT